MSKQLKIESKSLNKLNEALKKANVYNLKITKNPLKENDKFVSILSADNSFDSDVLKNDDINIEELSPELKKEKSKLTDEILSKINDTLKTNKEIYSLLNRVREINAKDDSDKWTRNDEKNTAILPKKNAKLFIQNNNICLSHNGKIEIFRSVRELHDWLHENNYPIPEGICLHEATQDLKEFDVLNNRGLADLIYDGNKDAIENKNLNKYAATPNKIKPTMNPDKWYLSFPIGPKGKTLVNANQVPVNYTGDKKYLKYNWENYKNFDDILTDDINEAYQFVSKKHAEMTQIRLYSKYLKNFIPVKPLDDGHKLYVLKVDDNNYIKQNWQATGDLFTNDLNKAKLLNSETEGEGEIKALFKRYDTLNIDPQVIEIDTDELHECGTGTASLGGAVTWLAGNKKLDETLLDEYSIFGYEGTPFENEVYREKALRASAYLKWLFNSNGDYTTLDPNFRENFKTALEDFGGKQMRSRGDELWGSVYKSRYAKEHPMFRGLLDPETKEMKHTPEYYERIKQINDKYNINLNPEEPVIGRNISVHNKGEKEKWYRNFFSNIYATGDLINAANEKKQKYEKGSNLDDKIENTVRDLKNMHMTAANNPKMYGKQGANPETITNYLTKIINKYKQEIQDKNVYNPIIDKFIAANAEFPENKTIDKAILDKLQALKDAKKKTSTEQSLKEDDSPADFATGNTDMSADVSTSSTSSGTDSNIDMNSMLPETDDMPTTDTTPGFDDININTASGGDYAPDDQEAEQAIPPADQYQIIDVLVQDEDSEAVKVKVKNLSTGEILIKDLTDIEF